MAKVFEKRKNELVNKLTKENDNLEIVRLSGRLAELEYIEKKFMEWKA